ncbi:MAG: hypothetical protein M3O70_00840, partial [Actinomycetota bacterium]|nr:hypothetical protein [Actinomycetota bacterium]
MKRRLVFALLAVAITVAGIVGGVAAWSRYRATAHAATCEEPRALAARAMREVDDLRGRMWAVAIREPWEREIREKFEWAGIVILQNPDCFSVTDRAEAEEFLRRRYSGGE